MIIAPRSKGDLVRFAFGMCVARLSATVLLLSAAPLVRAEDHLANTATQRASSFLQATCYDCHQGTEAEGSLDMTKLGFDLADAPGDERRWVRIIDRVENGEMPPREAAVLEAAEKAEFLQLTGDWLRAFQRSRDDRLGRVRGRRLTRREIERSLHSLLGIDIPLADQLPEEARPEDFTTVADGQSMSYFQLERYLAVVDGALEEAFRRALKPEAPYRRELAPEQMSRFPHPNQSREAEFIDGRAVVWSGRLPFYGKILATTAPANGWYRFQLVVSGLNPPDTGGVWATVRSGQCVTSAPQLAWITAFEAMSETREIKFEAWLPEGHMLEIRPGDITLRTSGPGQGSRQNVSGIAIDRMKMEQFHRGPTDEGIRRLLFGDLEFQVETLDGSLMPVSKSPHEVLDRLLERFARRAFRRSVTRDEWSGHLTMATAALDQGRDLTDALRVGYRGVLCSPRFMHFTESPGRLDGHAIAARLSYMLTGDAPDGPLVRLADEDRLDDVATIREEAERLLAGEGSRRFVEDFSAEWLDLDQINFTQPDIKLFPDFDAIVQNSMLDETHTYLETLLRDDLSVTHLVDADFTFLNSRLARFYGIDGVEGDSLIRCALNPKDHRGGLLTQGAILKVTANGSNTSPVLRGVWVSERLLGEPIPPPPANVPAIEPDIRGAKTIREILEKHRAEASCAKCHVKIDPPGFALENYDPAGRWRDRYVQLIDGRPQLGVQVDASYALPDGRKFVEIDDFRSLIASRPRELARNLAEKLVIFGTGAPISFADRTTIGNIVDQAAEHDYGFRSILLAVVSSDLFLTK